MSVITKLIKRFIESICLILLLPFNRLFKKKYYIFYSPIGYTGNVKYVYEHFILHNENAIFITPGSLSYLAVFKLLLQAKYVFLSHGLGGLPLTIFLSKRIQLWHGLPIKKILLDYKGDVCKSNIPFINKIYKYIFELRIKISYNELVTSESILGVRLMESMRFNTKHVKFYGTPSISRAQTLANRIVTNKTTPLYFKVLYMPTWRDGGAYVGSILEELISNNVFWNVNSIQIHCKLHPLDLKYHDSGLEYSNVKIVKAVDDIVELLSGYDCLITDYSSVCFEYHPFNRPIIFYTPDIEDYYKNRESYINIDEFYQGQPRDIEQLKSALLNAKDGKCINNSLEYFCGENSNAMENIYNYYVKH